MLAYFKQTNKMLSDHISATIVRFETYPREAPTGYAVGFAVTCTANAKATYRDVVVLFSELSADQQQSSDEEVVDVAWKKIGPSIETWCDSVKDIPKLIGTTVGAGVIDVVPHADMVPEEPVADEAVEPEPVEPEPDMVPEPEAVEPVE